MRPSWQTDLGLAFVALLRALAWCYGALVVLAAVTAPAGGAPEVAAGLVLPLAPLVLTFVAAHLLAGRGRALAAGPFAVVAAIAGITILAARAAAPAGPLADLAAALGAVAACAVAFALLAPQAGTGRSPRAPGVVSPSDGHRSRRGAAARR